MLHHFATYHLWFVVAISMMCAKVKHLRFKIYIDAFGYLKRLEFIFWIYWLQVIIIDNIIFMHIKNILMRINHLWLVILYRCSNLILSCAFVVVVFFFSFVFTYCQHIYFYVLIYVLKNVLTR